MRPGNAGFPNGLESWGGGWFVSYSIEEYESPLQVMNRNIQWRKVQDEEIFEGVQRWKR